MDVVELGTLAREGREEPPEAPRRGLAGRAVAQTECARHRGRGRRPVGQARGERLEFTVLDTAWTFWQVRGQAACPAVPAAPASADALWTFIDETIGWSGYTDQGNDPYIPYYFQAATQLGYPGPTFRHVRKLRHYPGIYSVRSFVPRLFTRFDPWAMDDIDRWVRRANRELMFIYGENDPWSAERFEPGRSTRDTSLYVVPGATHSTSIAALPPVQRAEATATVLRWAGVPAATGIAPRGAEPARRGRRPRSDRRALLTLSRRGP